MEQPNPVILLKQLIVEKQAQHEIEGKLLKQYFRSASEKFTPVNMIKSTLNDVMSSADLKGNVINSAIGLTTGFLTKKVLVGNTNNPLTKLFGVIVEMIVARKVTNNAEEIKLIAGIIFKKLINKQAVD